MVLSREKKLQNSMFKLIPFKTPTKMHGRVWDALQLNNRSTLMVVLQVIFIFETIFSFFLFTNTSDLYY